jgi:hypothetical protein
MRCLIAVLAWLALSALISNGLSRTGTAAGGAGLNRNHFQSSASQSRRRSSTRSGTTSVLFAVDAEKKKDEFTLRPVVIIRRGRLIEPPSPDPELDQDTPAAARFAASYFRTGKTYHLLFGGGAAAAIRIVGYDRTNTADFAATARPVGQFSLHGPKALATDSATLGHKKPSRRAATVAQRRQAVAIAAGIFRRHGLATRSIKKMEVLNLTAGDLYGDGRTVLIGSFQVLRRGAEQNLFTILEPRGNGFRASLVQYHSSKLSDREDADTELLVDWLDFNGDGVAEVITENGYYEATDYSIYRRKAGVWRVLYQGAGGGV